MAVEMTQLKRKRPMMIKPMTPKSSFPRNYSLDLGASWFVGDILDDVEAGNRAGCRTVLVDLKTEHLPHSVQRRPTFVARDTIHALRIIQSIGSLEPAIDFNYRPASWQMKQDTALFSERGSGCSK